MENTIKEELKKIKGYENYYISNYGKIYNKYLKEISQRKATNGYMRANVRKGNVVYEKPHTLTIHRAVAEAFLPNYEKKPQINHKDGNKTNNNVNNLEWVMPSENIKHSYLLGLEKKYYGKDNKKSIKIYQYNKKNELLNIFYGTREAERNTQISHRDIRNNCIGKQKTCKDFIFSYEGVISLENKQKIL